MGLGDAKISEQQRHCPGFHTRTPVGMQGELPERDVLPGAGLADQCLGQRSRLPRGHHPTNDIAAEHVEDDVEIEVAPLHRPLQFRDIPGPQLVGAGGQQFRFGILGVAAQCAPLLQFPFLCQDSIQGPYRTVVAPLIEQYGLDGVG